ncbi:pre-B lymphocyte protein 3 isoform X2 [Columba livia]|uniref:pre-B lymphocyte protein 3 isoform X2 n=1 Tax=Columba livia TaxID=8932 RepID=UPI0031BB02E8
MQCSQGHRYQVKFGAAFLLQSLQQNRLTSAACGLAIVGTWSCCIAAVSAAVWCWECFSPCLKPSCSNASNVGAGVPKPPVSFTYASLEPAAQQPGLVQHRRPSPKQPPFLCPTMALGFMVLLLAGAVGTASRAQPVLTQPPAVSVLPGQTARLSCTLSPQYNISHFGISWWYQQHPGQSLRYLLYYNSEQDKHKPANIPDRFSATKDLARNACILIIASARNEDNGSYYCSLSQVFKWF